VGQDEDAQLLMRRAEQARRRRVAHAPKLSQDGFKAEEDMTGDVFEEDPFWDAFADDAGDFGPEVARIVGAAAFPSGTEGLAGISGENRVKGAAEGPGRMTNDSGCCERSARMPRASVRRPSIQPLALGVTAIR
jgi:hypothetical protein